MLTSTADITKYATTVAIEAKASGMGTRDLGCFYDDDWNLTDEEWSAVVEEAIDLYDTVVVPPEVARSWAKVNADMRAEARSEQRFMFEA